MSALRVLVSRLLGLLGKRRLEDDLDAELRSHLELLTAENVRRGMTPEEARRNALIKLGGVTQTQESYRDRRSIPML